MADGRSGVVSRPVAAERSRSIALAAFLAWLVPGLGHWYLGERYRALILFIVMTITFWGGVAVGGVRSTVTLYDNGAWIAAQACMGAQAAIAWGAGSRVASWPDQEDYKAPWPASTISVVYTGITGLLNVLVIIDVLARAERAAAATSARAPPQGGR